MVAVFVVDLVVACIAFAAAIAMDSDCPRLDGDDLERPGPPDYPCGRVARGRPGRAGWSSSSSAGS